MCVSLVSSGWKLYDLPSWMKQNVGGLPNKSEIKLQFISSHEATLDGNKHVHSNVYIVEFKFQSNLNWDNGISISINGWWLPLILSHFLRSELYRYVGCRFRNNKFQCAFAQKHLKQMPKSKHTSIMNHLPFISLNVMVYLKIDSSQISWLKWTTTLQGIPSPLTYQKKTPEVQAPFISLGAKKVPKIFGACVTTFNQVVFLGGERGGTLGNTSETYKTYRSFFFYKKILKPG